jgi:multidrug efflux system membrane fusion protein
LGAARLVPLAFGAAPAKKGAPGAGAARPAAPPVPVVAAEATRGDVGVWLSGLGTVVSFSTIAVRPRVDGELVSVGFSEGQPVAQGQLLAQIDPRPFQAQLDLAQGQLSRDRALLANARRDLRRYAALDRQDSISRQQYDTQRSLVKQLEGTVQTDQGNVDNAKLQLSYTRITSPISGRVGLRLVDPGNIVHASDATGLVTLVQHQPIAVVFSIAQDDLPSVLGRLRAGESLRVDAFDRGLSRRLASGQLLATDSQIDPTTGTVKLKARFANADSALFPGQFVNARLLVATERDKTLVPAAALQRGAQATFVYVVKPDHSVAARSVETGASEGDRVAVERGLAPGELVVVDGADRLREGSKVQLRAQGGSGAPGGAP